MPSLRYKAIDAQGKVHSGQMEAGSGLDLELRLGRMGLDLIKSREINARMPRMGKIGRRELISFCFHLEQLIGAGVPLLDGLADIRDSMEDPGQRQMIAMLIEHIEGGKTLSGAMEEFPQVFGRLFIAPIRAGEVSGQLGLVLGNLMENLKWTDETAAHVKKLFLYPAIMGSVVLGIVFFLLAYLVPKLVAFFGMMGQTLPVHTRFLIAVSDFFVAWWHWILSGPVLMAAALYFLTRTSPAARTFVDTLALRVWVIGPIRKKIILSRFAAYFALLYAAGIDVLECIWIGESLLGNKAIEEATRRAARQIADGAGISTGFESAGVFPPLVIRMLRVGENTGGLDVALKNVSYFYDREVRESIGRLQTSIEPVMTVVMGVLLGWIMISVLGPMYDLITDFG